MFSSVRSSALNGVMVGGAMGALVVIWELAGLGSWDMLPVVWSFLLLVASVAASLALPFQAVRARAARFIVFALIVVVFSVASIVLSWPARALAFSWLAERSEPLVMAISRYEDAHGYPPATLEALVPDELDEVPWTKMPAYPDYAYEIYAPSPVGKLYWYDLGDRNGQPAGERSAQPDAAPEHAVLVVQTDRNGVVFEARADGLPILPDARPFDRRAWADGMGRMQMAADLIATVALQDESLPAVIYALGPPDGERELIGPAWRLSVPCSVGLLNWDEFVFRPNGPGQVRSHGAVAPPVGTWVYIHE